MPWLVRKRESRFCVYKEGSDGEPEGDALGCHESAAQASEQRAALYASEQTKSANMADWCESRIHQQFTVMADDLFGNGMLTREERIGLSNAIGNALDAFHTRLQEGDLAALRERGPYQGPEAPMTADASMGKATLAVKALGADRIGGYAVLWGDSGRKDLTGEYFTPQTEEITQIFDAMKALPYLYHHAMNGQIKASVIGKVDVLRLDDIGAWYEVELNKAHKYKQAVVDLAKQQALHSSSGTLPGARKVANDGRILRWPVVEVSGTTTPAESRMLLRPITEIKDAFMELGLTYPYPVGDGTPGAEKAHAEAVAVERERLALLELESTEA